MCMTTALCIIPFFKSKIGFPTNLIEKTNLQCGTRTRFVRDIIFNINSFRCCKFCCGKFEQSWRKNVQKIAHSSSDMLMTEIAWSYSCILFIISANQKLAVNIKTARVINISHFFSIFQRLKILWRHLLTSLPVWAIITAHFCFNWVNFTCIFLLPSYFREAQQCNILDRSIPDISLWPMLYV